MESESESSSSLAAYDAFLDEQFDAVGYASRIIQGSDLATSLGRLLRDMETVQAEIKREVVHHNGELLQQVVHMEELEEVLRITRGGTESFQLSIDRLKERIHHPYQQIERQTRQLQRLQTASELFRRISRFLQLRKRLKSSMESSSMDLPKAAQTINELKSILADPSMNGVHVIENGKAEVEAAEATVVQQADHMLKQGLQTNQHAEVGLAVQVFFNLEKLPSKVQQTLEASHRDLLTLTREALDHRTLGSELASSSSSASASAAAAASSLRPVSAGVRRVGQPPQGMASVWQASLWSRLEKLMDAYYDHAHKIWLLENLLSNKRDASSHATYLEVVSKSLDSSPVALFWRKLSDVFEKEVASAMKYNPFIQTTLLGEYPKLLRLVHSLLHRVSMLSEVIAGNVAAGRPVGEATESPERVLMQKSLQPLELEYLQRCHSRMFEPINAATTGKTFTFSQSDINNMVQVMVKELEVAQFESRLLKTVAKSVASAIRYFCNQVEQMIVTDSSAFYFGGSSGSSPAQTKNIQLTNSMYSVSEELWKAIANFPEEVVLVIRDALDVLHRLIQLLVEPMLFHISDHLEAVLLGMHEEDFSSDEVKAPSETAASAYIVELNSRIQYIHATYLAHLSCGRDYRNWMVALISRVLTTFLYHASILRPLSDRGKLKLAADMTQIENSVMPLLTGTGYTLVDVGVSYRSVRAFKPLLFLDLNQIATSYARGDLSSVFLLHHLIVRASPDLPLPHKKAQWTPQQYVRWLEEHTEAEAVQLIRHCVESYAADVRKRGQKEYTPAYPVILKLMSSESSNSNQNQNGSK